MVRREEKLKVTAALIKLIDGTFMVFIKEKKALSPPFANAVQPSAMSTPLNRSHMQVPWLNSLPVNTVTDTVGCSEVL